MPKFRKKPVLIEAIQWDGTKESAHEIVKHLCARDDGMIPYKEEHGRKLFLAEDGEHLRIVTLEGEMLASPGDYIIKGVKGELYPCKPDIFDATYEPGA